MEDLASVLPATHWISRLRVPVRRAGSRLAWLPPSAARLTLGWIFVGSGGKAFSILPKVIVYFAKLGIPSPQILAPFVAAVELVCGALMILGLCTRLASLPLIGTMLVAILTAKNGDIHEPSDLLGLSEYLYIVLCLWLGAYGAGPLSLDALFAKRLEPDERSDPAQVRTSA